MPSYEQIELIGGPCNGEIHSWDGGDYFDALERPPVKVSEFSAANGQSVTYMKFTHHTYVRSRDDQGKRTNRFIYQEQN